MIINKLGGSKVFQAVGITESDQSFGDATWFLGDGTAVELVVYRRQEHTTVFDSFRVDHIVTYLPTIIDVHVNDPQFVWFLGLLVVGPSLAVRRWLAETLITSAIRCSHFVGQDCGSIGQRNHTGCSNHFINTDQSEFFLRSSKDVPECSL